MKVLITGGAGFIGSHIADALVRDDWQVCVLDDLSTGKRENVPSAAHFIQGDIRDASTVDRVFSEFGPDVVCHQAAQTSVSVSTREPFADAQVNIFGTLRLLEAATRHDCRRFVLASTGGAMYGNVPDGEKASISWLPNPLSPYGCSKLAAESYVRAFGAEHGLDFRILRYANVYGPRQDPHGEAGVVAIFVQRLLEGHSIKINARQSQGDSGCIRDYVYVQDVVAANRAAILGELQLPLANVATGVPTSTLVLARLIEEVLGRPAALEFEPRRAGDLESSILEPNTSVASGGLRAGIAATVEWFATR